VKGKATGRSAAAATGASNGGVVKKRRGVKGYKNSHVLKNAQLGLCNKLHSFIISVLFVIYHSRYERVQPVSVCAAMIENLFLVDPVMLSALP